MKNSLVSRLNSCTKIRGRKIEVIEARRDNPKVTYVQRHWKKERDDVKHAELNIYSLERFKKKYCGECNECFLF